MPVGRIPAFALLLALIGSFGCVSKAQEQLPHCFSIHLTHDRGTVHGPHAITLLNESRNLTVEEHRGKFCIPLEMAMKPILDMSFTVDGDRFYLTHIPMGRFDASWDISYGEDEYAKAASLPRSKALKACTVVFHQGEPETAMTTYPCRLPAVLP